MKDRHLLFSEDVACRTKYFSGEEIVEKQRWLYRRFLFKRWLCLGSFVRIAKKIRSIEDLLYVIRIGLVGVRLSVNLLSTRAGVTSKTLKV